MIYKIPENATILSIKEDAIRDDSRGWCEGLIIETNKGDIRLGISTARIGVLYSSKRQTIFLNLLELKFFKLKI